MKTFLDCIPCFFSQALFTARTVKQDDKTIKKILDRLGERISGLSMDSPPPESGRIVYEIVREATGIDDPFASLKSKSIQKALRLYPSLKARVENSPNPLDTAARLAIAGNVIDFGVNRKFEIEDEIRKVLKERPTIYDFECFKEKLEKAKNILYLGDNAGETVFDRILMETIGKRVIYAVRERPIINDATYEDALRSGIGDIAEIVSSGSDAPGTILHRCSASFLDTLDASDLIISKGQGNFESLYGEKWPIFYLLKVKCRTVAGHLGLREGSLILMGT